jgi:hypothetical protein
MTEAAARGGTDLDALVRTIEGQLVAEQSPPHIKRDAHPKMHGCVQAVLRVDDHVAPELRRGVFAEPGKEYLAWVRFSNAFGDQHDLEFDTRGMAIKVLEVEGTDRLLPASSSAGDLDTQDFLFATHSAFFLPDTRRCDYTQFTVAAKQGGRAIVAFFVKNRLWRGLLALGRSLFRVVRSPLAIPYFSQTPYQLGEDDQGRPNVVKLQARPCLTSELAKSLPGYGGFLLKVLAANLVPAVVADRRPQLLAPRNLLRQALATFLADNYASFEILVQRRRQGQDRTMPIDDASVPWSERRAPFERVATLRIPSQAFWPAPGMPKTVANATGQMVAFGERQSFNPWHGIAAHRPLGDINEARRRVYVAISAFRRGANHADPALPTRTHYEGLRKVVQDWLMARDPQRPDR